LLLEELTEETVKEWAGTPELFLKAQHSAETGCVRKLEINKEENEVTAEVIGNHGIYKTRIKVTKEGILSECECTKKQPCKHATATLLKMVGV